MYSHVTPSALEDQRKLIEDLARSNQEYTRKFKELTKTVEASSDQLDAVKNSSTKDEGAPPGYLQANIVLPPPEPVNVASEPSTDIKNRHVKLTMQQIPPDSGKMSDELEHYCLLINHLLERIDAVQYKIRNDVRRRIRSDVVHMHEREADQLREVHGHGKFSTAMDSAISWVQALQHIDLDASQTLGSPNIEKRRTMYEKYDDIVLEDDDGR